MKLYLSYSPSEDTQQTNVDVIEILSIVFFVFDI